jgi:hypothetical protein
MYNRLKMGISLTQKPNKRKVQRREQPENIPASSESFGMGGTGLFRTVVTEEAEKPPTLLSGVNLPSTEGTTVDGGGADGRPASETPSPRDRAALRIFELRCCRRIKGKAFKSPADSIGGWAFKSPADDTL